MEYENDNAWIREILRPGETLLWYGRPAKVRLLRKENIYPILFSLLLCGFMIFCLVSAIRSDFSNPAIIGGFIMLIFTIYITVAKFIHTWHRNRNTRYALTSERIISKVGKDLNRLKLASLRINVIRREDGIGDIYFFDIRSYFPPEPDLPILLKFIASFFNSLFRRLNKTKNSYYSVFELCNIPDVEQVEQRIRYAIEQADRLQSSEE